jgi:hypothetical protein
MRQTIRETGQNREVILSLEITSIRLFIYLPRVRIGKDFDPKNRPVPSPQIPAVFYALEVGLSGLSIYVTWESVGRRGVWISLSWI